jgi:hypothetical protein
MAAVNGSEGGDNDGRLKRGESYWGRPLGLHGAGEGGGDIHGATAREDEEAALGRCGEGGRRLGGPHGVKG